MWHEPLKQTAVESPLRYLFIIDCDAMCRGVELQWLRVSYREVCSGMWEVRTLQHLAKSAASNKKSQLLSEGEHSSNRATAASNGTITLNGRHMSYYLFSPSYHDDGNDDGDVDDHYILCLPM